MVSQTPQKTNVPAIISGITGLLSVATYSFLNIIPWPQFISNIFIMLGFCIFLGVIGIILGIIALVQMRKNAIEIKNRWMAHVGLISGSFRCKHGVAWRHYAIPVAGGAHPAKSGGAWSGNLFGRYRRSISRRRTRYHHHLLCRNRSRTPCVAIHLIFGGSTPAERCYHARKIQINLNRRQRRIAQYTVDGRVNPEGESRLMFF